MKQLVICIFLFIQIISIGQNKTTKKEYTATKITSPPKIDGVLNDEIWAKIPELGNFVMLNPEDGTPERITHKTKVKIAYTDEAVYIAAYLYVLDDDSIF